MGDGVCGRVGSGVGVGVGRGETVSSSGGFVSATTLKEGKSIGAKVGPD